jgi:nucleotide-binding universal stress UspA family protein
MAGPHEGSALHVWREKLEYLQKERATVSDPSQKFTLDKQIQEALLMIRSLQGESDSGGRVRGGSDGQQESRPKDSSHGQGKSPAPFDVFLSHNSEDKPAVRELAYALKARGLKVWLDEWELRPGHPWQEALEQIIETTKAAAVLVGKDGLGPWQDAEMRGCLSEFVTGKKAPVIPVLLPGAPQRPKLPLFLKGFTWVDLRHGLTVESLDRLEWGITGKKPKASNLPSEKAPVTTKDDAQRPSADSVKPTITERFKPTIDPRHGNVDDKPSGPELAATDGDLSKTTPGKSAQDIHTASHQVQQRENDVRAKFEFCTLGCQIHQAFQ